MRIEYKNQRVEYANKTVDYRYTMYYAEDPKGFKVSELIEVLQHIYANKSDSYISATIMKIDDMFTKNINEVRVCEWADGQNIGFYNYN